jgi:hypothetical protein
MCVIDGEGTHSALTRPGTLEPSHRPAPPAGESYTHPRRRSRRTDLLRPRGSYNSTHCRSRHTRRAPPAGAVTKDVPPRRWGVYHSTHSPGESSTQPTHLGSYNSTHSPGELQLNPHRRSRRTDLLRPPGSYNSTHCRSRHTRRAPPAGAVTKDAPPRRWDVAQTCPPRSMHP